jgi:RsiW-degrading membrane proteinase PrsW (M82 family)
LLLIVGALQVAARAVTVNPPNNLRFAVNGALALLPFGLWAFISFRGERRVFAPRERLLWVVGLTMLTANGVGLPLIERVFGLDEWLSNTSGLQRIIGYALTAGFIQEFIKLAVVRFAAWEQIKSRRDGVAYSFAASVGYATVLSLNYAFSDAVSPPSADAMALRVAGYALSQAAIGTICGYTLGDLKVGTPFVIWLPVGLGIAALIEGVFVSLRAGLVVSGITLTGNASQTPAGLGIAVFLVLFLFGGVGFLISTTDTREQRSP